MRITRARGKSLGSSDGVPSVSESTFKDKRADNGGVSLKRVAGQEIKAKISIAGGGLSGHNKRRAVMKDISNLIYENVAACADTVQVREPRVLKNNAKAIPPATSNTLLPVERSQTKIHSKTHSMTTFRNKYSEDPKLGGSTSLGFPLLTKCCVSKTAASLDSVSNEVSSEIFDDLEAFNKPAVTDIDSKEKD